MKTLTGSLALSVCLCLLASTSPDDIAKAHIKAMQNDGSITNAVNLLVKDGLFCSVRGHAWGMHVHQTLEYVPDRIACRECKACGLHQAQYVSEWK